MVLIEEVVAAESARTNHMLLLDRIFLRFLLGSEPTCCGQRHGCHLLLLICHHLFLLDLLLVALARSMCKYVTVRLKSLRNTCLRHFVAGTALLRIGLDTFAATPRVGNLIANICLRFDARVSHLDIDILNYKLKS